MLASVMLVKINAEDIMGKSGKVSVDNVDELCPVTSEIGNTMNTCKYV